MVGIRVRQDQARHRGLGPFLGSEVVHIARDVPRLSGRGWTPKGAAGLVAHVSIVMPHITFGKKAVPLLTASRAPAPLVSGIRTPANAQRLGATLTKAYYLGVGRAIVQRTEVRANIQGAYEEWLPTQQQGSLRRSSFLLGLFPLLRLLVRPLALPCLMFLVSASIGWRRRPPGEV